jgi:prepilin-type processing-associated H-X9-DG protein
MKRRKLTGWEKVLFITPFLALLMLPFIGDTPSAWRFSFFYPREKARRSVCRNNLKQLGLAIKQYARDYDGRFPPTKIGGLRPAAPLWDWQLNPPVGWVDALYQDYTKNMSCNHCPLAAATIPFIGPNSTSGTHFWLNGNLSAASVRKISRPLATMIFGEGNDGKEVADGTYNKTALSPEWLNDYASPCYRHMGGANYAFADGHVKWLKPAQISTTAGAAYTFSVW